VLIQIVGAPFTGKTVSAATFPKPMLFIDLDGGFHSVKFTKGKDGKLVVPDYDQIIVVELTSDTVYKLDVSSANIKDAPAHTKDSTDILSKYNAAMDKAASGDFKSLVVDSASTMFRIWEEAIMQVNKISSLRIADYKTLQTILFSQWLPSLRSLAKKMWVVVVNHEMADKDELTGAVSEFPLGPSANMGRILSRHFDAVWRQKVEAGSYVWRTRPIGLFQGIGSRFGNLPDPIDANFKSIQNAIGRSE